MKWLKMLLVMSVLNVSVMNTVQVSAKAISEKESESISKAQKIQLGMEVSGNFTTTDYDDDFYKIELSKNTSIKWDKDFMDGSVELRLYNKAKKRVYQGFYSADSSEYFNLEKGTYYLCLNGKKGKYKFTLEDTGVKLPDQNNYTFKTAKQIDLGDIISGWPSLTEEKQVYTFDLAMGTYACFYGISKGTYNVRKLSIYDENKKLVERRYSYIYEPLYLSKGKYYLCLETEVYHNDNIDAVHTYKVETEKFIFSSQKLALRVQRQTKTSLSLKWKKQTNTDGYRIYYRENGSNKYKLAATKGKNTTSYTLKKLKPGEMYDVKVVGFKTRNGVTYTSQTEVSTIYTAAPGIKNVTNKVTDKQTTFKWSDTKHATGWHVYVFKDSNSDFSQTIAPNFISRMIITHGFLGHPSVNGPIINAHGYELVDDFFVKDNKAVIKEITNANSNQYAVFIVPYVEDCGDKLYGDLYGYVFSYGEIVYTINNNC